MSDIQKENTSPSPSPTAASTNNPLKRPAPSNPGNSLDFTSLLEQAGVKVARVVTADEPESDQSAAIVPATATATATATSTSTATSTCTTTPTTTTPSAPTSTSTSTNNTVLDIPSMINLLPHSRILVLWELAQDSSAILTKEWWPATLLPSTGRTHLMTDEETGDRQEGTLSRI
mmetsp:Transcript_1575/g.3459  ORF Transcript_1575/g.3459 Transcript_1575/m.3459 type:complete len:175 (+) Transcript_1575:186-710(+)